MPRGRKTNWRKRTRREKNNIGYISRTPGIKSRPRLVLPKHVTPFPPQYNIKLVYTGWVGDAKAGNGVTGHSGYTLKLNSCHDPWAGITGAYNIQPYFWDQISNIYKRYLVTSAKVELRCSRPQTVDAMVVMRPSTVSTTPSDFQLEESRPYAQKRLVSTQSNGGLLKGYYPVYRIHGVPPSKVKNDDLYAAEVGSDPTLVMYLQIIQQNAILADVTDNKMPYNIKITQYVTMFDRTIVSGS